MSYADIDEVRQAWSPKPVYDEQEEVMYFT